MLCNFGAPICLAPFSGNTLIFGLPSQGHLLPLAAPSTLCNIIECLGIGRGFVSSGQGLGTRQRFLRAARNISEWQSLRSVSVAQSWRSTPVSQSWKSMLVAQPRFWFCWSVDLETQAYETVPQNLDILDLRQQILYSMKGFYWTLEIVDSLNSY